MAWLLSDISNDPMVKWAVVIAASLTILYAVMRPLRRRKDPLQRTPNPPSLATQRAVERDMNNLLLELSEMARQITAQLDTRAMKLELLIKDAEEKIAQLKGLGARDSSSIALATNNDPAPAPEPPKPKIDPRHQEVYELSDQRLSSQEIANRLSRPRGEIELILNLRHKSEV